MALKEVLLDIGARYNAGEVISTEELVSLAQMSVNVQRSTSTLLYNGVLDTVTKMASWHGRWPKPLLISPLLWIENTQVTAAWAA